MYTIYLKSFKAKKPKNQTRELQKKANCLNEAQIISQMNFI